MKAILLTSCALLGLLLTACDQTEVSYTSESDYGTETASALSEQANPSKPVNEIDPIPGTTPPGSRMDPSSNAYIILDGSGSMNGGPINEAKRAVTAFVREAPDDLNIGLFVFDNLNMNGSEVVPLGKGPEQRKALQQAISRVKAGGRTPLGSAIMQGTNSLIKRFQMQLRYGDIRLIVVTDGAASDPDLFERSISHASKHHVPIYTIGFHMRSSHPLRQHSESYLTASDERELLEAMQETLAELDDDAEL